MKLSDKTREQIEQELYESLASVHSEEVVQAIIRWRLGTYAALRQYIEDVEKLYTEKKEKVTKI